MHFTPMLLEVGCGQGKVISVTRSNQDIVACGQPERCLHHWWWGKSTLCATPRSSSLSSKRPRPLGRSGAPMLQACPTIGNSTDALKRQSGWLPSLPWSLEGFGAPWHFPDEAGCYHHVRGLATPRAFLLTVVPEASNGSPASKPYGAASGSCVGFTFGRPMRSSQAVVALHLLECPFPSLCEKVPWVWGNLDIKWWLNGHPLQGNCLCEREVCTCKPFAKGRGVQFAPWTVAFCVWEGAHWGTGPQAAFSAARVCFLPWLMFLFAPRAPAIIRLRIGNLQVEAFELLCHCRGTAPWRSISAAHLIAQSGPKVSLCHRA